MISADNYARRGTFWSAVGIAHEQGRLGQGKRIAILDSGFDLSQDLLVGARVNSRTTSKADAMHGTAVAMIVAIVAPRAELLLCDVMGLDGRPDVDLIASSLDEVASENVDVICMSFGDRLPRLRLNREDLPILQLFESGGEPSDLRSVLREWIAGGGFKGHMNGGCTGAGEICLALDRLSGGRSLLVAAAGNNEDLVSCPAVHDSVLAVGFHLYSSAIVNAERILEATDIPTPNQSLYADLTIDQVPGFAGTSFAAPLVAGFAALLDNPKDMHVGALIYQAVQIAKQRHMDLCPPPVATDLSIEPFTGVNALYEEVSELIEEAHSHGESAAVDPCAYCSLLLHDLGIRQS